MDGVLSVNQEGRRNAAPEQKRRQALKPKGSGWVMGEIRFRTIKSGFPGAPRLLRFSSLTDEARTPLCGYTTDA